MSRATKNALRLIVEMGLMLDRRYSAAEMAGRLCVDHRTVNRDLLDLQGDPLYLPLTNEDDTWGYMEGYKRDHLLSIVSALGERE